MVRPERDLLSGTVELDEAMVGGRGPGKQMGPSSRKVAVMVAIEVDGRKLGRVRLERASTKNSEQLVQFAHRVVAPGAIIRTDGQRTLRQLGDQGFKHEYRVMVSSKEPAHEYMPGVHIVASLLKRWIAGTLHYGLAKRQMDYYLDEFTFRFNRRSSRSRGLLFYRLLQQAVATDPRPMHSLVGGTKPI